MQKKSVRIALVIGVLTIGLFMRFYQISLYPPGIYPDEAMNGNNALETLRTGNFPVFHPENNGREALFINIQALFIKATGIHEGWVLRLASVMFGTATVLGVYFLTAELFTFEIALLAEFFIATGFGTLCSLGSASALSPHHFISPGRYTSCFLQ